MSESPTRCAWETDASQHTPSKRQRREAAAATPATPAAPPSLRQRGVSLARVAADLQAELKAMGVSTLGMLEKTELVAAYAQAVGEGKTAAADAARCCRRALGVAASGPRDGGGGDDPAAAAAKMRVSQLQAELKGMGVSTLGMLEKSELVAAYVAAVAAGATPGGGDDEERVFDPDVIELKTTKMPRAGDGAGGAADGGGGSPSRGSPGGGASPSRLPAARPSAARPAARPSAAAAAAAAASTSALFNMMGGMGGGAAAAGGRHGRPPGPLQKAGMATIQQAAQNPRSWLRSRTSWPTARRREQVRQRPGDAHPRRPHPSARGKV
ncbi:hypothetical protein JL721_6510 [Aureococcus anophagefferens]|nr:hypothetical protein JL721_6510 [Aureococcus anophagefferens]